MNQSKWRSLAGVWLLAIWALALPWPGEALAQSDRMALNFRDADIDAVVGAYGQMLGRTFLVDPRVRGKLTLETAKPVTRAEAYRLLLAALRLQGFTVVEIGGISRVIPEADAKVQTSTVVTEVTAADASGRASAEQVVTRVYQLRHESAANLVPVLRPLIPTNNTIVAYPGSNSLVITDYAPNLERVARIIEALDVPGTGEVEVVALRHALATDVAVQVARLLDESVAVTPRAGAAPQAGSAAGDGSQRLQVLADARINSVLLRSSSAARIGLARALIERLDQPSSEAGNIRVVYLRNAEATRLVPVLRAVLMGEEAASAVATSAPGTLAPRGTASAAPAGGLAAQAAGQSPATSALGASGASAVMTVTGAGAVIAADPATNSLIITAPEPVYRNLRMAIDKLDTRRVQVYIESLIVEVQAETATELGVQWQFLSQPSGSGVIGGTNLPARGSGGNIIDATANLFNVGRGLNIGVVRSQPVIGSSGTAGAGVTPVNLGLLARALETEAGANILATPNLITLDNEEARIIIGQNVPFITGSFTQAGASAGSVNPFQTIERRDVGTTLRVRPQVAEGGAVKMQIFQEVSSVQDASLAAGLITNKRAIESNVLVDDGQVIVLGGLIEERLEGGVGMVPGLGRLPLVGNLFRYDTRRRVKTNLLVFLRPVVLRNTDQAYTVTSDRYDYIRQMQGTMPITPSPLIETPKATELDTLPPRPGTAGAVPPSLSPQINQAMPDRWRSLPDYVNSPPGP